MDKLLTMSIKELTRLEVMQRLEDKHLRQKEATRILALSTRQVKRLRRTYRNDEAKGLVSKWRGKASYNRLDAGVVQQTLDLIHEKYADFGPTLVRENLNKAQHQKLSRESF